MQRSPSPAGSLARGERRQLLKWLLPEPIPRLTPMPLQKATCPPGILLSLSSSLLSSSELSFLLGPMLPR